jgi:ketosteroid isomerase-like protein
MRGERDSLLADRQLAIENLRRGYEAVNSRDFATMAESFDPEIEWRNAPEMPGSGIYHGSSKVVAEIKSFLDVWEDFRVELQEVIPVDDRAVAVVRFHVRGRGSKIPLEGVVGHIWTQRNGKAVRLEAFMTKEQALDAAGLRSSA